MRHVEARHPKNEPTGAILWPRHTPYVCGDRVRGTVVMVMENGILEMTPEFARSFADEMLVHVSDVQGSNGT